MTGPKKTPWFDSTTPPSRVGMYEGNGALIRRVEWNGSIWFAVAAGMRLGIRGPFKWRGLRGPTC